METLSALVDMENIPKDIGGDCKDCVGASFLDSSTLMRLTQYES